MVKNVLEERRRMLVMERCPRQCLWISVEGLCGPGEGSCVDMPPVWSPSQLCGLG